MNITPTLVKNHGYSPFCDGWSHMAVGPIWSIILGITKTFVNLTIQVKIVRERAKTAEVGTGKLKMCRKTHGDPYFF